MKLVWQVKAVTACVMVAGVGCSVLASGALDSLDSGPAGTIMKRPHDTVPMAYDAVAQVSAVHPNSSWDALFSNVHSR